MKRSRFSEEQIIGILKKHQVGLGAKDFMPLIGTAVSSSVICHWCPACHFWCDRRNGGQTGSPRYFHPECLSKSRLFVRGIQVRSHPVGVVCDIVPWPCSNLSKAGESRSVLL